MCERRAGDNRGNERAVRAGSPVQGVCVCVCVCERTAGDGPRQRRTAYSVITAAVSGLLSTSSGWERNELCGLGHDHLASGWFEH